MCEEAVYDVVALGELLIDFTPVSTDGAGCPTLKANPGGAPGNLLAALSRYGRRTAFLGKVGEDAFGRLLLESLRRAGVQTRGIRLTSSAFTTLAFVTLDAAGDRSFSFARKPGADTQLRWEEVDRSLIQRCRLFHFGSLSLTDEPARSATRTAVAYARELGRTVTFDPNLRLPLWPSPAEARAQILWSLCQADVVKLSDEEVDFLWGCSPQEGARRLLEECGCTVIAIPCNTSHYFVDRIQQEIGIPILHMIRETARTLVAQGKRRPAILATDGTIRTGLYQKECAAFGLEAAPPEPAVQRLVMSIIYEEIKRGERGSREKFAQIDRALASMGCDCAILGCTELSVFRSYHSLPPFYVDAMEVLAELAVVRCGKQLRTI